MGGGELPDRRPDRYIAHRATQGRREFASIKGLEAEQYVVSVDATHADDAIRLAGLL